jgi:hypothetical protein
MTKLIYILIVTVCLNLNCFVNTTGLTEARVTITHVSVDSAYTIKKRVLWQTQIYPSSPPQYYDANVYRIRLDAHESTESLSLDSKFIIVCLFNYKPNEIFPLQANEVIRSSAGELSLYFPVEVDKSGYVGFKVLTEEESEQQNRNYYYGDINEHQKIYLEANTK